MSPYKALRILLSGIAAVGVVWAASVFGAFVEQFLAGVFGGGVMAAAFLIDRDQIP